MASETQKRAASSQQNILDGIKTVLLDIEGTTTPISFVHDKLLGYIKDNVKEYISSRLENEEVQTDVEALRKQAYADKEAGVEGVVEIAGKDEEQEKVVQSVVDNVLGLLESDRKTDSLKQLQGHMLRDAYKTGKIQGEIFDDTVELLKLLKNTDRQVYTFSTASVELQKLLFGYSDKGDLQEFLTGYYDTTVGNKTDKESYMAISGETGAKPAEMLFLTDSAREASCASEVGLQVALVVREGNTPLTEEEKGQYASMESFSELMGSNVSDEPPAKRPAPGGEAEESNGAVDDDDDDLDDEELGDVDDDEVADEEAAAAE